MHRPKASVFLHSCGHIHTHASDEVTWIPNTFRVFFCWTNYYGTSCDMRTFKNICLCPAARRFSLCNALEAPQKTHMPCVAPTRIRIPSSDRDASAPQRLSGVQDTSFCYAFAESCVNIKCTVDGYTLLHMLEYMCIHMCGAFAFYAARMCALNSRYDDHV